MAFFFLLLKACFKAFCLFFFFFLFLARSSWQLAERGGGNRCRRGSQQALCRRKRVPSHPIPPHCTALFSPFTSLLSLSPQGFVTEPAVPPQQIAVTDQRELRWKERMVFIHKVSTYVGFPTAGQSPGGFPSLAHPRAHEHRDVCTTMHPVVPMRAILLILPLLLIFPCFPTHISVHL